MHLKNIRLTANNKQEMLHILSIVVRQIIHVCLSNLLAGVQYWCLAKLAIKKGITIVSVKGFNLIIHLQESWRRLTKRILNVLLYDFLPAKGFFCTYILMIGSSHSELYKKIVVLQSWQIVFLTTTLGKHL